MWSFRLTTLLLLAVPALAAPSIRQFRPQVIGMGGKLRLEGSGLGSSSNAVVIFSPNTVATQWLRHTATQITVRVPYGAQSGNVRVVTGVGAASLRTLQEQIDRIAGVDSPQLIAEVAALESAKTTMLARSSSNAVSIQVTFAFLDESRSVPGYVEESGGVQYLTNRLIVDLADFQSFDLAAQIGSRLNADLIGHNPPTNSYIFQLRSPPGSVAALNSLAISLRMSDSRIVEAWKDLALVPAQVKFADTDWVDRYRHIFARVLRGREDGWAADRIQAPGAWNLIERFVPARDGLPAGRGSLFPVKVYVMDSGIDQDHADFRGVRVNRIELQYRQLFGIQIPIGFQEMAYTGGDPVDALDRNRLMQHGTAVASLIGAANGATIPQGLDRERGVNGLLHNPMTYSLVFRSFLDFGGGTAGLASAVMTALNEAALSRAKVVNASFGSACPINPAEPARLQQSRDITTALRKISETLRGLRNQVLLVPAAGNCGIPAPPRFTDPDRMRGRILPFVENGANDKNGNELPGSLGTQPNVLTVGGLDRDDQRWKSSNWGTPVQIAAPSDEVFVAGRSLLRDILGSDVSFELGTAFYLRASGTSFAAPLVSGAAGLLWAIDPRLTPEQVKGYLTSQAFPIDTYDGNFDLIDNWPTLKVGFSVRKLLVDKGLVMQDQPWSGVSKIAFSGGPGATSLYVADIRRAGDGRSEAFAVRTVDQNGSPVPNPGPAALTHDGTRVTYRGGDPPVLKFHRFDTNQFANVAFTGAGQPDSLGMEHGPAGHLLFAVTDFAASAPRCEKQVRLYPPGNAASAGTLLGRSVQGTCGVFAVEGLTMPPGFSSWALSYSVSALNRDDRLLRQDLSLTAATMLPPAASEPRRWLAYTPDGAMTAYVEEEDGVFNLVTDRLFGGRERKTPLPRFGPRGIADTAWSPDGSELAFSFQGQDGIINSIRRDARVLEDREQKDLFKSPGNFFIRKISWRW